MWAWACVQEIVFFQTIMCLQSSFDAIKTSFMNITSKWEHLNTVIISMQKAKQKRMHTVSTIHLLHLLGVLCGCTAYRVFLCVCCQYRNVYHIPPGHQDEDEITGGRLILYYTNLPSVSSVWRWWAETQWLQVNGSTIIQYTTPLVIYCQITFWWS